MFPSLQPSRPQVKQQAPRPGYAHQQKRATHEQPHQPRPNTQKSPKSDVNSKPRNQIEAMPPFYGSQAPPHFPPNMYNSAIRHPVFFTEQLRKPPFPIPQMAAHKFSPVASGYILENRKVDPNATPKTKL